jgi:hypothetical protein
MVRMMIHPIFAHWFLDVFRQDSGTYPLMGWVDTYHSLEHSAVSLPHVPLKVESIGDL